MLVKQQRKYPSKLQKYMYSPFCHPSILSTEMSLSLPRREKNIRSKKCAWFILLEFYGVLNDLTRYAIEQQRNISYKKVKSNKQKQGRNSAAGLQIMFLSSDLFFF